MNTSILTLKHNYTALVGTIALGALALVFIFSALSARAVIGPEITTTIHTASHATTTQAPIGSVIHGNAVVATSTASTTPTGTVDFNRYANTSCEGTPTTQVVTLISGEAESATTSVPTTGLSYKVRYNGDADNVPSEGSCVALTPTLGHITVDKITNPSTATTTFHFQTDGAGYEDFDLTNAASPNNQTLAPGIYRIRESSVSGWKLTSATCSLNGATSTAYKSGSNLTLNANDTIACTFTNTQKATSTDDDGDDNGKHKGFFEGLPFGIFKKIFGDEDFPIPPGIRERFLNGDFFKNFFHHNDDDDGDDDDEDEDNDDDDKDHDHDRGRSERNKDKHND